MVKKHCPKCGNYSYSAQTSGKWICPTCGYDLSHKPAMSLDRPDLQGVATSQQLSLLTYKQ